MGEVGRENHSLVTYITYRLGLISGIVGRLADKGLIRPIIEPGRGGNITLLSCVSRIA